MIKKVGIFLISIILFLSLASIAIADVLISEIMYNPASFQAGGDANAEWIELYNNGSSVVDLTGWQINDDTFNAISIGSGEYIVIAEKLDGAGDTFESYWGNNDTTWDATDGFNATDSTPLSFDDNADMINLTNSSGALMDQLTYDDAWGADDNGKTIERYNFASSNWAESSNVNGTPGAQNSIYDTTPPTLSPVSITSSNSNTTLAKVGDTVTITFTSDETLGAIILVTIDGNAADAVNNLGGNQYSATRVMQAGDTDSQVAFTINYQDQAGNSGSQVTSTTDASAVTFDETPPSIDDLTSGSPTTGDLFVILGNVTDNIGVDNISVQLTGDATLFNESVVRESSTKLTFEYYVLANTAATSLDYTLNVNDTLGNAGQIGPISMSVLDNDAPQVSAPTSPIANSWHNSDISVSVAVTDNIGVNRVYAVMQGTSVADTEQIELTGPSPYTGTFDITTLDDGNYTLTINATDAAKNENLSATVNNISVDDTLPVMTSLTSNITNNITRSDDTVLFTLTATELNPNTITLSAGTPQTMTSVGANTYTYTGTPQSLGCSTGETTCTATATIVDFATNSNTIDYIFKIDDTAPRITINTEVPNPMYNNDSVNVSALITDLYLNNVVLWENSTGVNVSHNLGDNGTGTYSYLIDAANLENMETVAYWFYSIDDAGNENTSSAQFTVSNRDPTYNTSSLIENKTVDEGQAVPIFSIAGSFYDIDGDTLEYYYTATPSIGDITILIDNATGNVNITPNDLDYFGDSYVTFWAVDPFDATASSQVVQITYVNVNDAPRLSGAELPDIGFEEDTYNDSITLNSYFYDPDSDPITWSWYSPDSNILVDINNATTLVTITAAPDFYGTAILTLRANDGVGGEGSDTINLNITSVNDNPVIDDASLTNQSILNLTRDEDFTTFTFDLTPYESDVDDYDVDANLMWNITGVDTSLVNITLDASTDVLTFQSIANAYGSDTFTLTLNDSFGATDTLDLTITIQSVNDDPVIDAAIPTVNSTDEDTALAINLKPYESDVDDYDTDANLIWSVSGVDTSLMSASVDTVNDILIINPAADQSGSDSITLTLTDSMGATDTQAITITINPVNDAPVIQNSPLTTATQDQLYTYEMNATDVENDILTYSVNDSRFAQAGNVFTWTPTQADVDLGSVTINFSVSDGNGGADDIVTTISTNNQNDAPVIQAISDQTAYDDILFSYQVVATDADNDALTYSLSDSPFNMEINATGGLIEWIPDDVDLGLNNVTVIVRDTSSEEDRVTFRIDVINTNDAPTIPVLSSPTNNSLVTTAAMSVLMDWQDSTDVDNDPVSYNVYLRNSSDTLLNGVSTSPSEYTFSSLVDATTYYWYVIATDGTLSSPKSEEWTFTTSFDNPPSITNPEPASNPSISETESIIFNATLVDVDGDNMNYNWSVDGATSATGTTSSSNEIVSFTFNTDYDSAASSPYTVMLEAKDTNNNDATPQTWTVTVANTNRDPVLSSISTQTVDEDVLLEFNITALDQDGDTLTYSCNLTALTVTKQNNSLATVSWTPTNTYVGDNDINCSVTDSLLSDSQTFVITVSNTNDAPEINTFDPVTTNPVIAASTGSQLFDVSGATDPDNDPLTYAWYFNDTLTGTTTSTYTVSSLPEGNYNVTAVVSDASLSASQYWNLVVSSVPVSSIYSGTIFSQSDLSNAVNVTITHPTYGTIDFGDQVLDLTGFVDVDRYVNISNGVAGIDSSTYPVFSSLSSPVTITMTGLSYSITPILYYNSGFTATGSTECPSNICSNKSYDSSAGTYTFTVPNFSIFWLGANTSNQPPEITSSPKTTATQFREYSYDVDATDVDNDPITYSLTTSPSDMTISSSSGLITWTPNATGNYSTTVAATAGNHTTSQSFTITVSEGSRLFISKVDVKVDGKSDKDLDDRDTISKEAGPDDDIEFKIEVENLYTDEENLDIDDIIITVEIMDIDDGDDLEEESNEFNLDPEDDKKVTLDFTVPLEVDEDTYEVKITAEGEDDNNTELETTFTIYLEVEKKSHEIRVRSAYLSPSEISCQRTTRLETTIINTGNNDEDEVSLEIENTALRINRFLDDIELDEGTEDNTYEASYTFDISDDVQAGTYPISIKTYYDSRSSGDETVDLTVRDCVEEKVVEEEHKVTVQKIDDVVIPPVTEPVERPVTEITFRESTSYLMMLILLYIIVTAMAFFMLFYLITAKKR